MLKTKFEQYVSADCEEDCVIDHKLVATMHQSDTKEYIWEFLREKVIINIKIDA